MKHFVLAYLLPFLCALLLIFFISAQPRFNASLFPAPLSDTASAFDHIPSFGDNAALEDLFLDGDKNIIWVLGSSELTSPSEALPFRFLPAHFPVKVKAVGHAGNQCFSIFCQLLANEEKLPGAKLILIISPSWFESKAASGTSSAVFLEYISSRWQKELLQKEGPFAAYARERIADLYTDFNSPGLELKLINFISRSDRSLLHKAIYAPVIHTDRFLLEQKEKRFHAPSPLVLQHPSDAPAHDSINWEELIQKSKEATLAAASNNRMGINNAYYDEHIQGQTGNVSPVASRYNRELRDLEMLVGLLKDKKADASFIIAPLNPYYYSDLSELSPTITRIKEILDPDGSASSGFCNFFVTDTAAYSKAMLTDVMHFSDHGWYNIDHFIALKYHLQK